MPFMEAVRLALATIRVQKLKSFFTLIGVTIGVMFLIAVVSIVEGMSRYVENDFAGKLFGVNTFTLRRWNDFNTDDNLDWREIQRRPRLFAYDADLVRSVLPPGSSSAITNETFMNANSPFARPRQVQAVATEAAYFTIKKFNVTLGRAFGPQEVNIGARVLVIGVDVAEHFFKGLDPIGRELRMNGVPYEVIGVIEKQGSVFGFSLDRLAIAPYTSPLHRAIRPRGDIEAMIVQAPTKDLVSDGMDAAREALRASRKMPPGKADNFALETQDEAMAFFDGIKSKMVIFGTALPAIGLVVGAMVIMNIMLVAVAERTREIGVRKALGARRRDIMSQFLVESATLSVVGAAIGIGLGIGLAATIAALTPLPAAVAPWSIVAALVVGAGVGIAAGIYPASRAARLDPITALRQE
ncbi:ABC transporter permease [Gemmatimonas groenlandica]|uniref:ABC transporter permease n=1 Tax=Gemmatimonas groenlandica TaxID=2732249 RepID=A0A6M4IRW9_9BACT|nr:ABC transporter permease [Gemmatimonas groenlandica]QJR35582.1 ABC transporter permease [Gemmatimonas groenlandica]